MSTTYADVEDVRIYIGVNSSHDSGLATTIEAVSRQIDGYCQRHFYLDGTTEEPVARQFERSTLTTILFGPFNDLVELDDIDHEGTFRLGPVNRSGPEARPYTSIRRTDGGELGADPIEVSGVWGWPEVPAAVRQACLLQTSRVFRRADSPMGVAGFGEFGGIRVSQFDPDVKALLAPYCIVGGFA